MKKAVRKKNNKWIRGTVYIYIYLFIFFYNRFIHVHLLLESESGLVNV